MAEVVRESLGKLFGRIAAGRELAVVDTFSSCSVDAYLLLVFSLLLWHILYNSVSSLSCSAPAYLLLVFSLCCGIYSIVVCLFFIVVGFIVIVLAGPACDRRLMTSLWHITTCNSRT